MDKLKAKYPPQVTEEARADWNKQCKMFIHGQSFRDKTMRNCFERHCREYDARQKEA